MDHLPYGTPPRWWQPRLSPFWIRVIRWVRIVRARLFEGMHRVEVQGLEYVRSAMEQGHGILLTPKHAGHADAFAMLAAADKLPRPFSFLVGWQVFQLVGPVSRWVLQRHGCFSINREGNDIRAFRQAVDVVRQGVNPLVVFAEGEVFHNNEWVAPFRPGAAAIALNAARRATRPVVCIPAAIRYHFLNDPRPRLNRLMETLERKINGEVRPDLPLATRLQRFAERLLVLREMEYLGQVQSGEFTGRLAGLIGTMLGRLEERYGSAAADNDVMGRVTHLRQQVIHCREGLSPGDVRQGQARSDMDELEVIVQMFSYAKDYLSERPSLEHLAEILDKFEEDVLGAPTAHVRAALRVVIRFGAPVEVPRRGKRDEVQALTESLQQKVQTLLDELNGVAVPRTADREWVPLGQPALAARA